MRIKAVPQETQEAGDDAMRARASEVAESLLDTCAMVEQFADPEELDSDVFADTLHSIVFECEACGWWWKQSDGEDCLCKECREHGRQ